MRTRIIIIFCCFLILSGPVFGQKKETVAEKVGTVLHKFDEAIKPDKTKRASLESIFTDFYNEQEKLRDNIQGPSSTLAQGLASQDYQSIRKRNEAIITTRDTQLKKLLSTDELKKWQDDIEPALRNSKSKK